MAGDGQGATRCEQRVGASLSLHQRFVPRVSGLLAPHGHHSRRVSVECTEDTHSRHLLPYHLTPYGRYRSRCHAHREHRRADSATSHTDRLAARRKSRAGRADDGCGAYWRLRPAVLSHQRHHPMECRAATAVRPCADFKTRQQRQRYSCAESGIPHSRCASRRGSAGQRTPHHLPWCQPPRLQ